MAHIDSTSKYTDKAQLWAFYSQYKCPRRNRWRAAWSWTWWRRRIGVTLIAQVDSAYNITYITQVWASYLCDKALRQYWWPTACSCLPSPCWRCWSCRSDSWRCAIDSVTKFTYWVSLVASYEAYLAKYWHPSGRPFGQGLREALSKGPPGGSRNRASGRPCRNNPTIPPHKGATFSENRCGAGLMRCQSSNVAVGSGGCGG